MISVVDQLNEQAWALRNHEPKEASELACEASALAKEANYARGLAVSQLVKGYCHFRQADYKAALEDVGAATEFFQTNKDRSNLQRSLNTLGIIYGQTGDLTNALKVFLRTLRLCQQLSDAEGEANALNNLAIIYVYFGDYPTALGYYLKGLGIYREIGSSEGELKALQNVGVVYFELGRHKEALEYFMSCLDLLEDSDDQHTFALALMNVGRTYHQLGDSEAALSHQRDSLSIMRSQEDTSGVSYALDELGRTHLGMGELAPAEAYLNESLQIKQTIGDQQGEIETNIHLGTLYTLQSDSAQAAGVLQQALEQALAIDARAKVYQIHKKLAEAYQAKGDFEQAYSHLTAYLEHKEALFDETSDQRFQALRVGYEVEQAEKEKEIYRLKSVELAQANKQLQDATQQLERQAKEDPLTGLYNRRHFDLVLDTNYRYCQSFGLPMSVMICDIDNFKKVNDTFSHAVGDEVLIQIAQLFREGVRGEDTVARYGGEEFVIHFPETDAATAYQVCERLRGSVESYPWRSIHPDLKVTISVGVCDDLSLGSGETMIAKADDTLYQVKRGGKNHVRIWGEQALA